MNLGLGTVQFGLDYGATNQSGRTPPATVRTMLDYAASHAVGVLDTAALYGDSESVLGQTLARPHPFRIVTKTLALDATLSPTAAIAAVRDGFLRSLERLGEARLAGLLVHRPTDLLGPHGDALFALLDSLRSEGLVEKVGVSVYSPEETQQFLARYSIDLVQLPLNPLDQRQWQQGAIAALAERGVEIHIRSAFLQGLLLAAPETLPAGFAPLKPALLAWQRALQERQLTPLNATLGFLKGIPGLGTVICGATVAQEWEEIVTTFAAAPSLPPDTFQHLAISDEQLIDPRNWPRP